MSRARDDKPTQPIAPPPPRPAHPTRRPWLRAALAIALIVFALVLALIVFGLGSSDANRCDRLDDDLADSGAIELDEGVYDCAVVVTQPGRIITGSSAGTTLTDVLTIAAADVTVKGVRFDSGSIKVKPPARDVLIEANEFTACQGICIALKRDDETNAQPVGVTIRGNNLHDSANHFVGTTGTDVTIEQNTFADASSPGCEAKSCPEFIRLQAGGGWRIVGNRFTNAEAHGPQIRVFPTNGFTPALHDVLIANNIASTDVKDSFVVDLEGAQSATLQTVRVYVVNNTFLGLQNKQAIGIDDLGPDPLVANNLLVDQGGQKECDRAVYASNVARNFDGTPCTGIELGDFTLTDDGIPTDTDVNRQYVIDRAEPDPGGCRCVPAVDINGRPRTPPFDRGAAEHAG